MPKHLTGKITNLTEGKASLVYVDGSTEVTESFDLTISAQQEIRTFNVQCGMRADVILHSTRPHTISHITPLKEEMIKNYRADLQPTTAKAKMEAATASMQTAIAAQAERERQKELRAQVEGENIELSPRLQEILATAHNTPAPGLGNAIAWHEYRTFVAVTNDGIHIWMQRAR